MKVLSTLIKPFMRCRGKTFDRMKGRTRRTGSRETFRRRCRVAIAHKTETMMLVKHTSLLRWTVQTSGFVLFSLL